MLFQNGKLVVREIEERDKVLLAKWLSNPSVLEFYEGRDNPFDIEKVHNVFYASREDEVPCMVEFNGKEIGYIQFYPIDEETRKVYGYLVDELIYGIDQFIGEIDYWNEGIGTLLVTSMVNYLEENKQVKRTVMDPQVNNPRALRCYEKSGFVKVKLLPKREYHEGEYHDCWLIEKRRYRI